MTVSPIARTGFRALIRASAVAALLLASAANQAAAEELPEFVGRSYDLRYDNGFRVIDTFVSSKKMRFKVLSQPTLGRVGSVKYHWRRLGPRLYVIFWTEEDGGTVVHVDDFAVRLSRSYYIPRGREVVESVAKIPGG